MLETYWIKSTLKGLKKWKSTGVQCNCGGKSFIDDHCTKCLKEYTKEEWIDIMKKGNQQHKEMCKDFKNNN